MEIDDSFCEGATADLLLLIRLTQATGQILPVIGAGVTDGEGSGAAVGLETTSRGGETTIVGLTILGRFICAAQGSGWTFEFKTKDLFWIRKKSTITMFAPKMNKISIKIKRGIYEFSMDTF